MTEPDASGQATVHALVTGGAGFIGSHLVEELVGRGQRVTVVDNFRTGDAANLAAVRDRITVIEKDLGVALAEDKHLLEGVQVVYHLAANAYIPPSVEDPIYDFDINLKTTLLLLETLRAMRDAPRLVFASTGAVYGDPDTLPIRETDVTVPISPYGVSKLAAERYVDVYSRIYGTRATSVRLFSVYGPRQRKQVVFDLLKRLSMDKTRLDVIGDGLQSRDFTYVKDVVNALAMVSERAPGKGEVYNLASGRTYTVGELVAALCSVCGESPLICYSGQVRPGDSERWEVDTSLIKQLGFRPRISLRDGLVAVRDWFETTCRGGCGE